jgi:S-adenosylmethionine synthetase
MIGYASNETEEQMPLTHLLAHNLCRKLRECYEKKSLPWIQPDHKTQVTVEYKKDQNGNITPVRVHTILISVQHTESVTNEEIENSIKEQVIK